MWTTLGVLAITATAAQTVCIETRRATAELVLVPVDVEAAGIRRSYWFLLDTGSGATVVDDEVARALKLLPTSRTTVVTSSGSAAATTARLSLTFGSVRTDLEVIRHPLTDLHAVDRDVHGIVGQDVLRRTNWLLDYRRSVVIQDPSGTLGAGAGAEPLAVRWIGDRPVVNAAFGRSSLPLVLDSAATSIVLYSLPAGAVTAASTRLRTLGPTMDVPMFTADELRVGSIAWAHPVAALAPQAPGFDEARGVLPTALFESVYFDQRAGAAFVTPAPESGGARRIIRPRCDAADSRVF